MPYKPIALTLCAWVLSTFLCLGQAFQRINDKPSRIAHSEILDIHQDKFGFLWFATSKGLMRYDGHQIKVYQENPLDSHSIGDNFIKRLTTDSIGNLWVGTTHQGGIFKFDPRLEQFTSLTCLDPSFSKEINDFLWDHTGKLWIATDNGIGWVDMDKEQIIPYRNLHLEILGFQVTALAEDSLHQIWITTGGKGLHILNAERNEIQKFERNLANSNQKLHSRLTHITIDYNHFIWVAGEEELLYRINPTTLEATQVFYWPPTKQAQGSKSILTMLPDPKGYLWLGTRTNGLLQYDPITKQSTHFRHHPQNPKSIASDIIGALMFDHAGTLWVGHHGSGVSQMVKPTHGIEEVPISSSAGMNYECLLEDRQGNIWVGTSGNGVLRYNPKSKTTSHYTHQPGQEGTLAHNLIWDIHEDKNGDIWIGTHAGLQRFLSETASFETYNRHNAAFRHEAISSIAEDQNGTLWLGTFGGLHSMDKHSGEVTFYEKLSEQPYFIINKLFVASDEHLWISGHGRGVFRMSLQTKEWVLFEHDKANKQSITSNIVLDIEADQKGRIWLATQSGGLNQFQLNVSDPKKSEFRHWRPYHTPLAEELIWDISISADHTLWLSTPVGLISFQPDKEKWNNYQIPTITSGLSLESKSSSSRRNFIGDREHLYVFHPDSLQHLSPPPPIVFTDFHIMGHQVTISKPDTETPLSRSITHTRSIALNYDQNDLTFEFAALNYIQSDLNQYQYQLKGYDKEPLRTDAWGRKVRYTNLDPGSYIFTVKGSNHEQIWNTEGNQIAIHISPPLWKTIWAYVFYALVGFCIIYFIHRFDLKHRLTKAEINRQKAFNTQQSKLYTNVTHEFRTPLTIILGLVDHIKGQVNESTKFNLNIIKRNTKQLLNLVNQLLDLSKIESGHLQLYKEQSDIIAYLKYLLESFQSIAEDYGIKLIFKSPQATYLMDFDPIRLMHIINNLISNAIKFSPNGGQIILHVQVSHEHHKMIQISVQDQGIGIPKEKIPFLFDRFYQVKTPISDNVGGTGIGLTLTKQLVELMGGSIKVVSEWQKGSTFTVLLPISQEAPIRKTMPAFSSPVLPPKKELPLALADTADVEKPLILIIEDSHDVVYYLRSILQEHYQISTAPNGKVGFEKATQLVPHLILTDVMMPEQNGFELCAKLKQQPLTSHIPIIMLTAKADPDSKLVGLKKGADDYLSKPFMKAELLTRIAQLLEQRRRLHRYYLEQVGMIEKELLLRPKQESDVPEDHFLYRLKNFIDNNLSNPNLTVSMLESHLLIGSSSLYRKVKSLTDLSPKQFISLYRMTEAKRLLGDTNYSISEIATQVGYQDPDYFTRVFKKTYGKTPKSYRQEFAQKI